MRKICVFNKIGSLVNRPDWRFFIFSSKDIILKLKPFIRDKNNESMGGYLKRFVDPDNTESFIDNTILTEEGQAIYDSLTSEEQTVFNYLQDSRLREQNSPRRIFLKTNAVPLNNYRWRLKDLENVKDEFFQKLIKHFGQIEYDENIEFAVQFKFSKDNESVFRYLGYSIYLGLPDRDIAAKWKLKISQITAIRMLFFDFSNKPTDILASAAYLRQLVHNDAMTQLDFEFYKIIDELGEVGLKARANFYSLTDDEKKVLKTYLSYSALENVFNIKQGVRTMKDASLYNNVVSSFNNFCLANKNLDLLSAREENVRASTEKIKSVMSQAKTGMTSTDEETVKYMELIHEMSLNGNAPPLVKTLEDLK